MDSAMKPFMEPKSVAIIGISRLTGPGNYNILENLLSIGYSGKIYPVNPRAKEILGVRVYPSVLAVPGDIELAVISMPRSAVPRIVGECAQKGIKSIIIITRGFDDGDNEGRRLQAEISRIARQGGARILGPNTWGIANAFYNFTSGFSPMMMKRKPIGFVAQTGFYFGVPEIGGKGIDVGNATDIDFADALEYYETDPDTKVIFLHIEGLRNGRRFVEVAARVSRKKPILALKTGREEEAAKAVRSHTGSLAGRDEVYDAAFKKCGVIRVNELDEFESLARAFLSLPLMKGNGIAVITSSGGAGIKAIDLLPKHHLRLARLSPSTMERLNSFAPPWHTIGNPADIWPAFAVAGHPPEKVFSATLDALLRDDDVHAILLLFPAYTARPEQKAQVLEIIQSAPEKPIICWPPGAETEAFRAFMEKSGRVEVFSTMDHALRAFSGLNARWCYLASGDSGPVL